MKENKLGKNFFGDVHHPLDLLLEVIPSEVVGFYLETVLFIFLILLPSGLCDVFEVSLSPAVISKTATL